MNGTLVLKGTLTIHFVNELRDLGRLSTTLSKAHVSKFKRERARVSNKAQRERKNIPVSPTMTRLLFFLSSSTS